MKIQHLEPQVVFFFFPQNLCWAEHSFMYSFCNHFIPVWVRNEHFNSSNQCVIQQCSLKPGQTSPACISKYWQGLCPFCGWCQNWNSKHIGRMNVLLCLSTTPPQFRLIVLNWKITVAWISNQRDRGRAVGQTQPWLSHHIWFEMDDTNGYGSLQMQILYWTVKGSLGENNKQWRWKQFNVISLLFK